MIPEVGTRYTPDRWVAVARGGSHVTEMKYPDPYEQMSDEEFDREVVQPLVEQATTISLRMPRPMLERTKEQAARLGVPYQRLMKALLASGLDRLEQSGGRRRRPAAG
jgi:predicted DNA binding CopG/RHH family protein